MTSPHAIASVGVGILGVRGYAGQELLRFLSEHPHAHVAAVGSRQSIGSPISKVLPGFPNVKVTFDAGDDPKAWRAKGVDVVFAALPHGELASRAQAFLDAGMRVVDLSADFRLKAAADYPRFYHMEHPAPDLLDEAVYGLPEWTNVEQFRDARLVASPGCYPTASLLGILPAVRAGWVDAQQPLVIHAMSGVSGAGRAAKESNLFAECGNSLQPYKVGESHSHLGEMKQAVRLTSGQTHEPKMIFNPHLVPMARGIIASITLPLARPITADEAQAHYEHTYRHADFVQVLDADTLPQTRFVRGSNRCDIAVRVVCDGTVLMVFSAIDNLVKGAAGQGVQCFNRMIGAPDTAGLPINGLVCA